LGYYSIKICFLSTVFFLIVDFFSKKHSINCLFSEKSSLSLHKKIRQNFPLLRLTLPWI